MRAFQPAHEINHCEQQASDNGQSVFYLVQDAENYRQVLAAFALADGLRLERRQASSRLHGLGIAVAMLTGDNQAVAKAVVNELDVDIYFAEVLPEHKDQKVAELQQQGKRVAMVGDGVNDARRRGHRHRCRLAIESAGIILVKSNPLDVVKIFDLSRASYRKMIENLIWAAGYNIVALPLAAGILAPWGILLSPAVGAVLMTLSTIIVAINAQLLRWHRLAG